MRLAKQSLLFLAVLAVSATAVQAEQVDNPEYGMWKNFKAGAMVKREMTTVAMGNETKTIMTITLKEITAEKAVVSTATSMIMAGGNKFDMPAQDRTIPAKMEKVKAPEPEVKPETEKGEETLTVAGKELVCKWIKTTVKNGGNTIVSKIWNSDEIPGNWAKMESSMEGAMSSKTTMTVTEYKAGE